MCIDVRVRVVYEVYRYIRAYLCCESCVSIYTCSCCVWCIYVRIRAVYRIYREIVPSFVHNTNTHVYIDIYVYRYIRAYSCCVWCRSLFSAFDIQCAKTWQRHEWEWACTRSLQDESTRAQEHTGTRAWPAHTLQRKCVLQCVAVCCSVCAVCVAVCLIRTTRVLALYLMRCTCVCTHVHVSDALVYIVSNDLVPLCLMHWSLHCIWWTSPIVSDALVPTLYLMHWSHCVSCNGPIVSDALILVRHHTASYNGETIVSIPSTLWGGYD